MLTLQILDEDDPFLVPLDPARALVLGSSEGSDIRLRSRGVATRHAKVAPIKRRDGGDSVEVAYKLVDLNSGSDTLVNGEAIIQVALAIGDRIELGDAVLVVGQQVRRAATPDDVLGGRRSGARRVRSRDSGKNVLMTSLVALVVVGVIVAAILWGGGPGDRRPAQLVKAVDLRQKGDFDGARAIVEGLSGWAGDTPERLEILAAERADIAAVESSVAAGREWILADGGELGQLQVGSMLVEQERSDESQVEREAARILRRGLRELLARLPAVAPTGSAPGDPTMAPGAAGQAGHEPLDGTSITASTVEADQALAAVQELAEAREWVQCLETLRSAMGSVDAAASVRLRERLDVLRRSIRAEMHELVGKADRMAARGDLAGAVAVLRQEAWRFPTSGDMTQLASELAARENELALRNRLAADSGAPTRDPELRAGELPAGRGNAGDPDGAADPAPKLGASQLAGLRGSLDSIREAELVGDYAQVAEQCAATAAQVATADPAFSRRLTGKARDFEALAAMAESIGLGLAGTLADQPVITTDERGYPAEVVGVETRGVRLRSGQGEQLTTWLELPPALIATLAERAKAEPMGWVGVAVHGYRQGDRERAEAALRWVATVDETLLPRISETIQRGRGDRPDPRGYALEKGEFVSVRDVNARKLGAQWARQLGSRLARGDLDKAAAWLGERRQEGPDALDPLLLALSAQRADLATQLEQLPIRKQLAKLEALRDHLDEARERALDLIYDEGRYFYPFRAELTDANREAEYWKVQEEIDARVAELRDRWEAKGPSVRVSPDLVGKLEALDWVDLNLLRLGHMPDGAARERREAARDVFRALPSTGVVTLQTFARTPEERATMDGWDAIEAYSEQVIEGFGDGAQRQYRITNGYRRMFGHRPLAAHAALFEAAQGHSEEMSTLGYFSHFSPTEGRKTPYERMRAAGYTYGVSENISVNSSALGAHNAWLHSSGHHRNLLNPGHTEFGVGVAGKYYTQTFGRGSDYASAVGVAANRQGKTGR